MNEQQFIKTNSQTWKQLENYSARIEKKGLKILTSGEVRDFLKLFRVASHHLAYARTHYPDSSTASYLNVLISRSHDQVYAVKRVSPRNILGYFTREFPNHVVCCKGFMLGAFALFMFGFLLSLLLVFHKESNAAFFLPQSLIDSAGHSHGASSSSGWNDPLMSSTIMVNNITIALKAFVFGITLGIGTLYVLLMNGMLLGALTALMYRHGNPFSYWSLILPHGIFELTAIFISGGAGLIIAGSLLLPGEYSRRDSIILGSKKAVQLVPGIAAMLVAAGIIEGFFTPLQISPGIKLIFAGVCSFVLVLYFGLPGIKGKRGRLNDHI